MWCLGGLCCINRLDAYAVDPQVIARVLPKGKGKDHSLLSQPVHSTLPPDWTCTFLHHLHSLGNITQLPL